MWEGLSGFGGAWRLVGIDTGVLRYQVGAPELVSVSIDLKRRSSGNGGGRLVRVGVTDAYCPAVAFGRSFGE